jgi:CBS domain containing-hemolysin-like protein
MSELLYLLLALALVVLCGVFVAAEFAFITVNRSTAERHAAKGDRKAQGVLQALQTLSTQLSGAQVGITITNLAIGFIAEPAISRLLEEPLSQIGIQEGAVHGVSIVLGVSVAAVVTMVFGELLPKNLAIAKPLATARAVQGIQRSFSTLMHGPIRILNGSANFLIRRLGMEPQEELASARSADELTSLVRRSAEKGTLPKETARMLERSIAFGELTATDVMTPRVRVRTITTEHTAADIIALARRTGHSRFPVVKTNLDDVVGVVHVKQAVGVAEKERAHTKVERIMQQPIVVPSSIELEPLLETLRSGGFQLAVIIDEFGGADGIVTIEDLIEELVGEVRDEHDRSSAKFRKQDDNKWQLSGLLRPDEVGQELGIFLPDEEEFETIGGLVADRLEHVPKVGEAVMLPAIDRDGDTKTVELRVDRMDGRRVDRLYMQVITAENPESSETQQ